MKLNKRAVAPVFAFALLSACDGAISSGGLDFIPGPPQSPDAEYANFNNLTKNQGVPLTGATFKRTDSGFNGNIIGNTTVTAQPYATSGLSITYNAATGAYTVRSGSLSETFGSNDLQTTNASFGPSFTNYGRVTGGTDGEDNALGLYKAGGTINDVQLTYTTIVAFSRAAPEGGNQRRIVRDTLWAAGGFSTLASDMPRTGSATYNGPLFGLAVDGATVINASGNSRIIADFSQGTIQSRLSIDRSGFTNLVVDGTGSIQSNKFFGTLAGGNYSGTFDGGFFGPKAAEMGLSFSLTGRDGSNISGAGAGRK